MILFTKISSDEQVAVNPLHVSMVMKGRGTVGAKPTTRIIFTEPDHFVEVQGTVEQVQRALRGEDIETGLIRE